MWRSRTDCVCAQAKSRGGSTVLAWSTACGKILLRRHEIPVAQAEEKEEEPGMKYPSSMSTIVQETLDSLPSKTKESSTGLWKLGRPLAARQPFAHPSAAFAVALAAPRPHHVARVLPCESHTSRHLAERIYHRGLIGWESDTPLKSSNVS